MKFGSLALGTLYCSLLELMRIVLHLILLLLHLINFSLQILLLFRDHLLLSSILYSKYLDLF